MLSVFLQRGRQFHLQKSCSNSQWGTVPDQKSATKQRERDVRSSLTQPRTSSPYRWGTGANCYPWRQPGTTLSLLGLINCPGKHPCKHLFHSTLSCSEVTTTTDPLEERSILLTHWALLYDLSPLPPGRLWEWTDEYFWSPDKRTSPDLKRYWASSCLQPTAWLNGMKVGWVFCYTKVFLTFLINSLSISGVEDTGGQSRLGAMQTARLKAFIWFSSDRISIPCSTPKM